MLLSVAEREGLSDWNFVNWHHEVSLAGIDDVRQSLKDEAAFSEVASRGDTDVILLRAVWDTLSHLLEGRSSLGTQAALRKSWSLMPEPFKGHLEKIGVSVSKPVALEVFFDDPEELGMQMIRELGGGTSKTERVLLEVALWEIKEANLRNKTSSAARPRIPSNLEISVHASARKRKLEEAAVAGTLSNQARIMMKPRRARTRGALGAAPDSSTRAALESAEHEKLSLELRQCTQVSEIADLGISSSYRRSSGHVNAQVWHTSCQHFEVAVVNLSQSAQTVVGSNEHHVAHGVTGDRHAGEYIEIDGVEVLV